MAGTEKVILPYRPRIQFEAYHARQARFAVVVSHRRAGKTVAAINDLIRAAIGCRHANPRCAYVAPFYRQAKDVAWGYLKHYTEPLLAHGATYNESELRVDFPNGARVRLYGADNPDSLRGLYHDAIVLDEYADMRGGLWDEVILPSLLDRGGAATFIGTPKGHNDFYSLYQNAREDADWYTLLLRASTSGIFKKAELNALEQSMSAEAYKQEFECSFEAAVRGAIYGDEISRARSAGRICRVPIERTVRVSSAWDLGMADATAIWLIQEVGQEVRLIDYIEGSGVGLDYYARALDEKAKEHGIIYEHHYLPHDVAVRELGTGRSRQATLRSLGINALIVPQHAIWDGVNATRALFDRLWIDAERCRTGLEALTQYRRDYDDKRGDFKPVPLHDWTSHAADALRTFAAGRIEAGREYHPDELVASFGIVV